MDKYKKLKIIFTVLIFIIHSNCFLYAITTLDGDTLIAPSSFHVFNRTSKEQEELQRALKASLESYQIREDEKYAKQLAHQQELQRAQEASLKSYTQEQIRGDKQFALELQQKYANQYNDKHNTVNDVLPLPYSMRNKRIRHLQARQQVGGSSCGYHTLINAKAIEDIVKAEKIPDTQKIKRLTTELFQKIPGLLENEGSQPLLETIGRYDQAQDPEQSKRNALNFTHLIHLLDNTYFITYSPTDIIQPAGTSEKTSLGDIYQALAKIKNQSKKTLHFPCLLGSKDSGHWVYIGVVKQVNEKPYIVVLDSCNSRISSGSSLEKIINKLYTLIQ